MKREKELSERSKLQASLPADQTQMEKLRKLFSKRKPSEPGTNVNSIQPSTEQTPAAPAKPSGNALLSLLARAKEHKEAEKMSSSQDVSASSPTKQKGKGQPISQLSEDQPLTILPHPQATKSKWAALAAASGSAITNVPLAQLPGHSTSEVQSSKIDYDKEKTETICKKSEFVKIVKDIRPAPVHRWSRFGGPGNTPTGLLAPYTGGIGNYFSMAQRPEPIEEYDEYNRNQMQPYSTEPDDPSMLFHDDQQSSSGGGGGGASRAIMAPRLPQPPNQLINLPTQQSIVVTTSDAAPPPSACQFFTAPTNLLDTQQFLTSMVELKMELRSEMRELSSKISAIDEHILEFAKISTWLVNNMPVAPIKAGKLSKIKLIKVIS